MPRESMHKINVVSPPFSRVNGPNSNSNYVVVHVSDHNPVMVAQVDYYIRANYSINAKGKLRYLTKLFIL